MYFLNATANFGIDQPSNTYIFDIVPLSDYIAAISSDDCLRLIDPLALSGAPVSLFEGVHSGITSLKSLDSQNSVVCMSGRDGQVNIFDFRAKARVAELRVGKLP
jgi:WD40 repeat protein